MRIRSKIVGTGMFVPERVVTNDDLSEKMDTTDEWIQKRTGIRERHWIVPGESPADLGIELPALRPGDVPDREHDLPVGIRRRQ